MITILVDHDVEGQAFLLWGTLSAMGWLELLPMRLVRLADVGLPDDSTEQVWSEFVSKSSGCGQDLWPLRRYSKGQQSAACYCLYPNPPSNRLGDTASN